MEKKCSGLDISTHFSVQNVSQMDSTLEYQKCLLGQDKMEKTRGGYESKVNLTVKKSEIC